MTSVLGLDAAWTPSEPSGVAVVAQLNRSWKVCALAPSYDSFFQSATGKPIDWANGRFRGSIPNIERLLSTAGDLAGARVSVVAIDMPIATQPFTSRRAADDAISAEFGARACSTHSPSRDRPGKIGIDLTRDLYHLGYPVATAAEPASTLPRAIEVYPHPALLSLLRRNYRVPYKVGKSVSYWPDEDKPARIRHLLSEMSAINEALGGIFGHTGLTLPEPGSVISLASLKKYEDALDALTSAWVGVRYLEGAALPFGDETAAIWVPR